MGKIKLDPLAGMDKTERRVKEFLEDLNACKACIHEKMCYGRVKIHNQLSGKAINLMIGYPGKTNNTPSLDIANPFYGKPTLVPIHVGVFYCKDREVKFEDGSITKNPSAIFDVPSLVTYFSETHLKDMEDTARKLNEK